MAKYVGWCNTLHSPARVEETVGFRRKPPRMKVAVPPFCWMNMPWIQSHNGRRRGLPGCQCEMNVSVVATQRFFSFTPNLGEMIQFDEHIFPNGLVKNHQLYSEGL